MVVSAVEPKFMQAHVLAQLPGFQTRADEMIAMKKMSYGDSIRPCITSQTIRRKLRMAYDPRAMAEMGFRIDADAKLFERIAHVNGNASIDTAIHIAHAFGCHSEESEIDFFSLVDELVESNERRSSRNREGDLDSPLFYGHVVVQIPTLVSKIEGRPASEWRMVDRALAAGIVRNLVHLLAAVPKESNRDAPDPRRTVEFLLVEFGDSQPRSLAGAFRDPVPARFDDLLNALTDFLEKFDVNYCSDEARRFMSLNHDVTVPRASHLDRSALANWAAESIVRLEAR